MIDVLHTVCSGVAFRVRVRPARGDLLRPEEAVMLDGSTPMHGDLVVCGTCGAEVWSPAQLEVVGGLAG